MGRVLNADSQRGLNHRITYNSLLFISANPGGEVHHPLQASPDDLDAWLAVAFAPQEAAEAGNEADQGV